MMTDTLNLKPLLRTLTIQDKSTMASERFPIDGEFAWAQRKLVQAVEERYNQGKPIRIIVLKARQLGISTVTEAILFLWMFLHHGSNELVIAHDADATQSLFEKTKLYWETWPYQSLFQQKYASQRRLTFADIRSGIHVASARNVGTGRARTIHALHASECAFYPDPRTLMTGLLQTIPESHGSMVILESTANGVGDWFYEKWQDATLGHSDYIPLFFPWYKHFEYRHPTSLTMKHYLDEEEKRLIKIMLADGIAEPISLQCIQFRRWMIPNKLDNDEDKFRQEYPATPEEAFITTGHNIFPLRKLEETFKPQQGFRGMLLESRGKGGPIKFTHQPSGNLRVFKAPTKTKEQRPDRYFVSGDPSMTVAGDPACIQVINRQSMEQVAVWHGRCDPRHFADQMMLMGKWYHEAMLCPEIEGGGQSVIAYILAASYPNVWMHKWADKAPGKIAQTYGWATNWNRKQWAVGVLKSLIADQSIIIHDRETYSQLRDYVIKNSGEMGPANETTGHDDAVMALSIGVTASRLEGPFVESSFDLGTIDAFLDHETPFVIKKKYDGPGMSYPVRPKAS